MKALKTTVAALALLAGAAGQPALANSMFDQGLQDRIGWEQWFNSLQGDYKTGAFYWAGQRSLPHPGSCQQMDADFYRGCTDAKVKLAATDALRKSEPTYKMGWNSYAATVAPIASAPTPVPQAAPEAPAVDARVDCQGAVVYRSGGYHCVPTAEPAAVPQVTVNVAPAQAPVAANPDTTPTAEPAAPAPQVEAVATVQAQPHQADDVENSFIAVVQHGKAEFEAGANEMAKGASRPHRRDAICNLLGDKSVSGWVGTIKTVSSNSDGKGVLAIEIAPNVTIETTNNSFSDIGSHTLIEPGSPVYQQAVQLKEGDKVTFSGDFVTRGNDADCVWEASLTQGGSMTDPDFVFRFTDLKPVN